MPYTNILINGGNRIMTKLVGEVYLIVKETDDGLKPIYAGGPTTINAVACFNSLDSAKRSTAYHNRSYRGTYVVCDAINGKVVE